MPSWGRARCRYRIFRFETRRPSSVADRSSQRTLLISAGVADPTYVLDMPSDANTSIRETHTSRGTHPSTHHATRRRDWYPSCKQHSCKRVRALASCCVADIRIAAPGGMAPARVCKTRTVFENMVLHIYDSVEGSLDAGGWCTSERA
jgi:hypothetical protein